MTDKRIERVLWGLPKGSTDAIDEKVLYTKAKTDADIERIKRLAANDGWHSFRVQLLDLDAVPNFAGTINKGKA